MTTGRVFELRAAGLTQQQIADQSGISRSSVSRILAAGEPVDVGPGELALEVEALVRELGDLDSTDRAKVSWLRALASKADQLVSMRSASSGVALANLTQRFRELVAEVRPAGDAFERLRELVSGGPAEGESERHRATLMRIASGHDGPTHPGAPPITGAQAVALARRSLYHAEQFGVDG